MLASLKSLLIGIPILTQIAVGGGGVLALSASTVAYHQTQRCHKEPIIISHYDEYFITPKGSITREDATMAKGTQKLVSIGSDGKQVLKHTVTKHCGKLQQDTQTLPINVKSADPEIIKVGTAYDANENSPINFEVKQTPDPTKSKGSSGVKTTGVQGVKQISYHYAKNEGEAETKTLVSESVVTPAIDEVDWYGTYVQHIYCTNGYYVNSDGTEVCSPTITNGGGATAQCMDGTYSYSLHRSGTCSHHGGVSVWY